MNAMQEQLETLRSHIEDDLADLLKLIITYLKEKDEKIVALLEEVHHSTKDCVVIQNLPLRSDYRIW